MTILLKKDIHMKQGQTCQTNIHMKKPFRGVL